MLGWRKFRTHVWRWRGTYTAAILIVVAYNYGQNHRASA